MNRETIRFQPNEGVTVALEFPEGVHVQGRFGPQVRFSLTDNRVMYLDLETAQCLSTLGVKPGESFRITKRVEPGRKLWWDFERIRAAGAILGNSGPDGADPVTKTERSPVSAPASTAKTAQPTPISGVNAPQPPPPRSSGLTRVPPQRASYGDAFVFGLSEHGREKLRQSRLGKTASQATRARMREAAKGRPPVSAETLAKRSLSLRIAAYRNPKAIARATERIRNVRPPLDSILKVCAANRGRKRSEAAKAKTAATLAAKRKAVA